MLLKEWNWSIKNKKRKKDNFKLKLNMTKNNKNVNNVLLVQELQHQRLLNVFNKKLVTEVGDSIIKHKNNFWQRKINGWPNSNWRNNNMNKVFKKKHL
jgi:hypothetical protein